jgi:ribonuclease HI
VKAHAGIDGNKTADRLAKEATKKHYVTYSRIPKSTIKRDPGRKYKKMAKSMGENNKRSYY